MTELERAHEREREAQSDLRTAREKREALERIDRAARLEPLKALAIKAHDTLCRWNHADGCGWQYECGQSGKEHRWEAWSHARWLAHLERITVGDNRTKPVPVATIDALLDKVIELRTIYPDALWLIRHVLEPT